jgi:hypothetical protein
VPRAVNDRQSAHRTIGRAGLRSIDPNDFCALIRVKGARPTMLSKVAAPRDVALRTRRGVLLDYIDHTSGSRIDQHWPIIHDGVTITPRDMIIRRYIIVSDPTLR